MSVNLCGTTSCKLSTFRFFSVSRFLDWKGLQRALNFPHAWPLLFPIDQFLLMLTYLLDSLGNFQLVGIPPAHRGVPQVEVTFDIDADSIVHVHAKDKSTNKDQSITIASGSGLSDSEIQTMVDDAEKYGEQDKERKAAIEAANRADGVLNDTEKALKDFADKIDKAEADQLKEKIGTLREFVAKNQTGEGTATAAELKEKTDELQMASLNLFDKMHKARSEEQQSSSTGNSGETPSEGQPGETESQGESEKKS